MLDEAKKNELTELCRTLIQKRSYSGEEQEMAEFMKNYYLGAGFDRAEIDKYGNIIARIKGNHPGKCVLFDGHIDTVPVGNRSDWSHDPFAGEIENGRLYGRGTTDMKGAVAAFSFAAKEFVAAHGHDFAGELCMAGVVHEECFEGISARAISEAVKPDLVVIGEASEMNLKCSQRGRAEIILETFGIPCHSSNPEKGVNAVYAICKIIEEFRKVAPVKNPEMAGDGIMELTDIKSAPYPGASVVPEYCRATYDRRLLVGETRESVLAPLQTILDRLQKEDPSIRAKVSFSEGKELCYTGETIAADRFFPGWLVDKKEDFVQKIYRKVCDKGYAPQLTGYSFCTNGSHYAGEAGIPCIGIGPSKENIAHTIDEYVELSELHAIADYYSATMEAMLL